MRAAMGLVLGLAAAPAAAHDLRVFAFVEGDTVNVEAEFSSGRVTRFALPQGHAATGLTIEVDAGSGHSDYRLLTPADIARGAKES